MLPLDDDEEDVLDRFEVIFPVVVVVVVVVAVD